MSIRGVRHALAPEWAGKSSGSRSDSRFAEHAACEPPLSESVREVKSHHESAAVYGFDPEGSDFSSFLTPGSANQLCDLLEMMVYRGRLVGSRMLLLPAPQKVGHTLDHSNMLSEKWPQIPLRVEEALSTEMLLQLLNQRETIRATAGGAISTPAQTLAAAVLDEQSSPTQSPGGGGGGSSGNPSLPPTLNGDSKPSKSNGSAVSGDPKSSATTPFLRDEAVHLERANEFDIVFSGEKVASGKVRRITAHFLVGEIVAQTPLNPGDWQACEIVIRFGSKPAYSGPAKLAKLVNTGNSFIAEWSLQGQWQHPTSSTTSTGAATEAISPFLDRLRLLSRISDTFKAVIADVATVLEEVKQMLDRMEVTFQSQNGESANEVQLRYLPELRKTVFPVLDDVFSRFERAGQSVPEELEAPHHLLVRQHLHPYLMSAPFIQHIYAKPLGYAGDFGALKKLLGDPYEGHTLFAKMINAWLVTTPAGDAYRHRIQTLVTAMQTQALRCRQEARPLRVLSIGCGAAPEIARFLATSDLSDGSELTLVDFNDITLAEAQRTVRQAAEQNWRQVRTRVVNCSIVDLVVDVSRLSKGRAVNTDSRIALEAYDLVYCTGLFDYFSDRVCQRITNAMNQTLAPGGSMIYCNFTPKNTIRHFMRLVLDWKLVYRTGEDLSFIAPSSVPESSRMVSHSPFGVEAFVHVEKTQPTAFAN